MLKLTFAKVTDDVSFPVKSMKSVNNLLKTQVRRRTLGAIGVRSIGMQFFSTQTGEKDQTETRDINIEEIKSERQMSSAMRM